MSAIAGIDQALWDIKGKYYDAPVYDLMGAHVGILLGFIPGLEGPTKRRGKEAKKGC